jgi:hypothetical protein
MEKQVGNAARDTGETGWAEAPGFSQGLNMLEIENNLMWLPTVANVPTLLALQANPRALDLVPGHQPSGQSRASVVEGAAAAPNRDP